MDALKKLMGNSLTMVILPKCLMGPTVGLIPNQKRDLIQYLDARLNCHK
jgi:hypothetical protein